MKNKKYAGVVLSLVLAALTVFSFAACDFSSSEIKYTLSLTAEGGGTVSGGGSFAEGASVTVTAAANAENVFDGWFDGVVKKSADASYSFNMPASNYALTAKFNPDPNLPATSFDCGEGTLTSPYIIKTKQQFIFFANTVNEEAEASREKYYKLQSNIDLANAEFTPIGKISDVGFDGNFDGGGFTVLNFTVTSANVGQTDSGFFSAGLFAYALGNAKIHNLNISGAVVSVECGLTVYSGALVGYNLAVIENCSVSATVDVKVNEAVNNYTGGITGHNAGTVKDCAVTGTVKAVSAAPTYIGGIAGSSSGYILGSRSSASVKAQAVGSGDICAAGVVGYNVLEIDGCSFTGDVDIIAGMGHLYAGGISGSTANATAVKNSASLGDITASGTLGGSSVRRIGGAVGMISSQAVVANCCSTGDISLTFEKVESDTSIFSVYVGGFIGVVMSNGTVKECYSTGEITANLKVVGICAGGFAGNIEGSAENSYSTGEVDITAVAESTGISLNAGGFTGAIGAKKLVKCFSVGNVKLVSTRRPVYIGGFAASMSAATTLTREMGYNFTLSNLHAESSGTANASWFINTDSGFQNWTTTSYRHEQQTIYRKSGSNESDVTSNASKQAITAGTSQFNSASFYTETLLYDTSVWDLTELDISASKYPTLRDMPVIAAVI